MEEEVRTSYIVYLSEEAEEEAVADELAALRLEPQDRAEEGAGANTLFLVGNSK
jgi:hypothetical protein